MLGSGLRLVDLGYSEYLPELTAGRQRLFPWDGSLRSALFPSKRVSGDLPSTLQDKYGGIHHY
jgi:hypothetical protein